MRLEAVAQPLRCRPASDREQIDAVLPYAASLHVDVMDGHFAPAFGLGERTVRDLVAWTRVPVDVHLMVEDPAPWAHRFAESGARRIAFHIEAVRDRRGLADEVRTSGALLYLALQTDNDARRGLVVS